MFGGKCGLALWLLILLAAREGLSVDGASLSSEPALTLRRDILFFENFEDKNWISHWGAYRLNGTAPDGRPLVTPTSARQPEHAELAQEPYSFQGKCLKVEILAGQHSGIGLSYWVEDAKLQGGLEEMYYRYYLCFDPDWQGRGGKLPGISGTAFGKHGWGGNRVDGRNGWSGRMGHRGSGDKVHIGWYCYHADMQGRYGSSWKWDKRNLGYLEKGRWYCIEGYAKMNTPAQQPDGEGLKDGILRGWIDGQLAFEKTDVRFRHIPDLKISRFWLNIYEGGTWTIDTDEHCYVDNVVVARERIGQHISPEMLKEVLKGNTSALRQIFYVHPSLVKYIVAERKKTSARARKKPDEEAASADPVKKLRRKLPGLHALMKESKCEEALTFIGGLGSEDKEAADVVAVLKWGVEGVPSLRGRVGKVVDEGKKLKTQITFGGMPMRATVIAADEKSIKVDIAGSQIPMPWDKFPPRRFISLVNKTLDENDDAGRVLLAAYAAACGLEEEKILPLLEKAPPDAEVKARRDTLHKLLLKK